MTSTTQYRDVVGIPGYRVGDDGTVLTCRQTSRGMTDKWRLLKCSVWSGGYIMATLRKDRRMIRRAVHVLVLEAFVGPRPTGMDACHLNDIPSDNRLVNLRWGTRQSNIRDRSRNGGTARGERAGPAKISDSDVLRMRELAASGMPIREIAHQFPVKESNVGQIVAGRTWAHVGGPLSMPSCRPRKRDRRGRYEMEVTL